MRISYSTYKTMDDDTKVSCRGSDQAMLSPVGVWAMLPSDLLILLAELLNVVELVALSSVCSTYRTVLDIEDDSLVEQIYESQRGPLIHAALSSSPLAALLVQARISGWSVDGPVVRIADRERITGLLHTTSEDGHKTFYVSTFEGSLVVADRTSVLDKLRLRNNDGFTCAALAAYGLVVAGSKRGAVFAHRYEHSSLVQVSKLQVSEHTHVRSLACIDGDKLILAGDGDGTIHGLQVLREEISLKFRLAGGATFGRLHKPVLGLSSLPRGEGFVSIQDAKLSVWRDSCGEFLPIRRFSLPTRRVPTALEMLVSKGSARSTTVAVVGTRGMSFTTDQRIADLLDDHTVFGVSLVDGSTVFKLPIRSTVSALLPLSAGTMVVALQYDEEQKHAVLLEVWRAALGSSTWSRCSNIIDNRDDVDVASLHGLRRQDRAVRLSLNQNTLVAGTAEGTIFSLELL